MSGYDEFKNLILSETRGNKGPTQTAVALTLGPSDDWWLEELGFRDRITSARKGLKMIASYIEAVSARRESILDGFI